MSPNGEEITLREYIEQRISEMNCRINHRFEEVDENVKKAETQLNHRLEAMNEFREAMREQSSKFLTRNEYDYAHKSVEKQIHDMELAKANFEGRAGVVAGLVSVAVSIVTGVLIFIVTHLIISK